MAETPICGIHAGRAEYSDASILPLRRVYVPQAIDND